MEQFSMLTVFIFSFIVSLSMVLNVFLSMACAAAYWWFKNSLSERAELMDRSQLYEDSKHLLDKFEQIEESVVELQMVLVEVVESKIHYNEPVYNRLVETSESLLRIISS
jgi:hypothetical protein